MYYYYYSISGQPDTDLPYYSCARDEHVASLQPSSSLTCSQGLRMLSGITGEIFDMFPGTGLLLRPEDYLVLEVHYETSGVKLPLGLELHFSEDVETSIGIGVWDSHMAMAIPPSSLGTTHIARGVFRFLVAKTELLLFQVMCILHAQ